MGTKSKRGRIRWCPHRQPLGGHHVPLQGPTDLCRCCQARFVYDDALPASRFWCGPCKPDLLRLDLACGQHKADGHTGVDRIALPGVDVVHDLGRYPWPFKDESAEAIRVSHYVEHIPMAEDLEGVDLLIKFMNECYRLLIVGGRMHVIAPWWASARSWQDPTHRRAISDASFLYYNRDWREANGLAHYPITADFDFFPNYQVEQTLGGRNTETQQFWMKHYVNVIQDITVLLVKRPPRPPKSQEPKK